MARYDFSESALRTPETCGVIDGSTWSPVSSVPDSGSHRHRWSTVWPGVCTTNQSRPPSRMRSPWCTRSVGSGGVNSMPHRPDHHAALAAAGPDCVVPHGVIAPHGLDVASVSSVSSRTTSGSLIVGSSSGATSTRLRVARPLRSRARRASPSVSARCGLGPFTVHVENAWCVIELRRRPRARCGPRRRSGRDASA